MATQRRLAVAGTQPVAGTGRVDFTGCRAGDDLYIVALARDNTVSAVPTFGSDPAGFTKLHDVSGGTRTRSALYHKTAVGTETTVDVTATGSGTVNVGTAALAIRGGTPTITHNTIPTGSINSAWDTPDVTTGVERTTIYSLLCAATTGSFQNTDSHELVDSLAGTSASRMAIYERLTKDTGTYDVEGTWGASSAEGYGYIIEYEPDEALYEVTSDFNFTEDPLSESGIWRTAAPAFASDAVMETNGSTAQGDGSSDNHIAIREDFYERDCEVEVEVDTKGVNGLDILRLYVRLTALESGATWTAYELRYEPLAGTDTLKIFRVVAGTATQIGSTQSQELANGDILKFRAVGQQLYVYVNGTEVYHWTDTAGVAIRGQVGFRVFGDTFRIDNFTARRVVPEVAAYVHAVTSGGSATAAATTNVTLPIALPGDIYLLHATTFKTTAGDIDVTVPGFTNEGSYVNGDHEYFILTRECDGSEGNVESATIVRVATATGTNPSSTRWRIAEITFVGNPDDIFDLAPFNENEEASSTSWTTDAVSGNVDSLLVVGVHHDSTSNVTSTCSETDVVETQDAASNAANTSMALYIKPLRTSTTEQVSGTYSGAVVHRSFIYSLNPPPAPPTTDSGTVTLTFTPSFVEVFEGVDADTVYLDLTPSGVDEYTGSTEYTDSGTIGLLLTPSFVEVFEAVDSGTVGLLFTPSGVDVYEIAYLDTGTIYLTLTPSGTEYIHVCKPRFRGELLTWTYDPDAMRADWYGGLLNPEWHGELLTVEMVANYAC